MSREAHRLVKIRNRMSDLYTYTPGLYNVNQLTKGHEKTRTQRFLEIVARYRAANAANIPTIFQQDLYHRSIALVSHLLQAPSSPTYEKVTLRIKLG